jgi:phosphomannomutase
MPLTLIRESTPPEPENEFHRVALGVKKRHVPTRLSWEDFAPDYIQTAVERGGCDFESATSGWDEPLRVAVEAGNGMGGKILAEFAKRHPQFHWTFSNDQPDGNFPLIVPNPLNATYQQMVRELVQETDSHMGMCFDGDADRVAVADEDGEPLSPPHLTSLVGRRLRQKLGPDAKIAFNLATSWVVPDTLGDRNDVLSDDARAVITPVGYGKIKPIMFADPQIAFGAEHSGHYLFREFWGSDSGMLAGLLMLEYASELHGEGRTLSQVLEEPRSLYCESGEINFGLPVERPGREEIKKATELMTDEIKRMYVVSDGRVHQVDQYPPKDLELEVNDVRCESDDWWFCMRTSGTEGAGGGLLRLYVEAYKDQALMEEKRDKLIEMVGADLRV